MRDDSEVDTAIFLKESISETELIKAAKILEDKASSLKDTDTLLDALELSRENPKEIIAIMSSHKIVGTLSKLEIISALSKRDVISSNKMKVKDIMNKKFIFSSSLDTLEQIYENIIKENSDSLVLKHGTKFVGMLDSFDLMKIFESTKFIISNPPITRTAMTTETNKIDATENLAKLKNKFIITNSNYCMVYKDGAPIGIVTIKDLLGPIDKENDLENTQVQNIMSPRIISINPWTDLHEVMKMAINKRFNQIPVMENDQVVGVLEVKNIVKTYYEFLKNLQQGDYLVKELE